MNFNNFISGEQGLEEKRWRNQAQEPRRVWAHQSSRRQDDEKNSQSTQFIFSTVHLIYFLRDGLHLEQRVLSHFTFRSFFFKFLFEFFLLTNQQTERAQEVTNLLNFGQTEVDSPLRRQVLRKVESGEITPLYRQVRDKRIKNLKSKI